MNAFEIIRKKRTTPAHKQEIEIRGDIKTTTEIIIFLTHRECANRMSPTSSQKHGQKRALYKSYLEAKARVYQKPTVLSKHVTDTKKPGDKNLNTVIVSLHQTRRQTPLVLCRTTHVNNTTKMQQN